MLPSKFTTTDIQSWWEVPSIAHFCSLFRSTFKLPSFDVEDLEAALLVDETEASFLQELLIRLLIGCLGNYRVSAVNYQRHLQMIFRRNSTEHDRWNPLIAKVDFQLLPLRAKVEALHALCNFRLNMKDTSKILENFTIDRLRVQPFGYDEQKSAYWHFGGARLYREDFHPENNATSSWQVVCFTKEDWRQLANKMQSSESERDRQLYSQLNKVTSRLNRRKQTTLKMFLEQPVRWSPRLENQRKLVHKPLTEKDLQLENLKPENNSERVVPEFSERKGLEGGTYERSPMREINLSQSTNKIWQEEFMTEISGCSMYFNAIKGIHYESSDDGDFLGFPRMNGRIERI